MPAMPPRSPRSGPVCHPSARNGSCAFGCAETCDATSTARATRTERTIDHLLNPPHQIGAQTAYDQVGRERMSMVPAAGGLHDFPDRLNDRARLEEMNLVPRAGDGSLL